MLSKHTLSPLTFNYCQFGTPLNSSYVPLLIGPIRRCFGHFFFYNKFLNLKKIKKKTDNKKKKKTNYQQVRAIFATRFLDIVSQKLSSQCSNKRSSTRKGVSDEFPISASHSHSPPPCVLCHGFNNGTVDGSCSYSCSAACVVCVRGKCLLMSSTILCFDGE